MKNKKGAEMTIGTIVFIILALVVLVVLIYGFSVGWDNFWQQLTGGAGGEVNVQSVVRACGIACSTASYNDYCVRERDVVFESGEDSVKRKCYQLEGDARAGLESCDALDCESVGDEGICSGAPNPDCNQYDDSGKSNCEDYLGGNVCKWSDDSDNDDANVGDCEKNSELKCADYNNNKEVCDSIDGCYWRAFV
jgi:hypothetical protein